MDKTFIPKKKNNVTYLHNVNHHYHIPTEPIKINGYDINFTNDLNLDQYVVLFYHINHSRITPLSIPIDFKQRHHKLLTILVIRVDISLHPDPVKFSCGHCYKPCLWWHANCADITKSHYDETLICKPCSSFHCTYFFFDITLSESMVNDVNIDFDESYTNDDHD